MMGTVLARDGGLEDTGAGPWLRVLIVEDSLEYAELLEGLLLESWAARLQVAVAGRVSEARAALRAASSLTSRSPTPRGSARSAPFASSRRTCRSSC